jgi:hypothetical protein
MSMATISPELLRPPVSKSDKKSKFTIIYAGIFLTVLFMSIFVAWSTGLSSSPTNLAPCTAKVAGLAPVGVIRDANSYNTAIYECTHMVVRSSIYGNAPVE